MLTIIIKGVLAYSQEKYFSNPTKKADQVLPYSTGEETEAQKQEVFI